jgi:hypothetical protein
MRRELTITDEYEFGSIILDLIGECTKAREKWSEEHDDDHTNEELAVAASSFANGCPLPFVPEWVTDDFIKQHPRERQLLIAAQFCIAEIGRLRRDAARKAAANAEEPESDDGSYEEYVGDEDRFNS